MNLFEWIDSVGGVTAAAKMLNEQPRAVAGWYYGEKVIKPQTAQKVIRVSKVLDWNRIYGPLLAKVAEKEAKALIKKGSNSGE